MSIFNTSPDLKPSLNSGPVGRVVFLLLVQILLLNLSSMNVSAKTDDQKTSQGIWKAVAPTGTFGEFNNYDPLGLIAGAFIKTDCSINWVHQTGKRYCFASGTSLVFFLRQPNTNIKKATKKWGSKAPQPTN